MFETVDLTANPPEHYTSVGGMVEIHVSGTHSGATIELRTRHPITVGREWTGDVFINNELDEVGLNRVALAAGTEFHFVPTGDVSGLVVSFSQNWSRA